MFYNCLEDGDYELFYCPEGTYFIPDMQVCGPPIYVPSCIGGTRINFIKFIYFLANIAIYYFQVEPIVLPARQRQCQHRQLRHRHRRRRLPPLPHLQLQQRSCLHRHRYRHCHQAQQLKVQQVNRIRPQPPQHHPQAMNAHL